MPTLTLHVPDSIWNQLQPSFNEAAVSQLAAIALEEWTGWLSGAVRPASMSELETDRLYRIYDSILIDDLPSVDELGRRFGLPLGRARYIMQSLGYRRGRFLRQRQIRAVLRALDHVKPLDPDNRELTIDRSCGPLVDRVFSDLFADKLIKSIPTAVLVMEGLRYRVGPNHVEALGKAFQALLTELQAQVQSKSPGG